MGRSPSKSNPSTFGTFSVIQDGLITSGDQLAPPSSFTLNKDQTKIPVLESLQAGRQLALGKRRVGVSLCAQEGR